MANDLTNIKMWTYGAEFELSDLDTRKGLPEGFGWDKRDVTMVNSNGIAVDPKQKVYPFGGEVNSPPTSSIKAQVRMLERLLNHHPDATINYRSNLHIHIRVPGLKENLAACKKIQRYIVKFPGYLGTIEPIPEPKSGKFLTEPEYIGAVRRYKRRLVSHHTTITQSRFKAQQKASSFEEFFAAECPADKKTGKPLFHLAPRHAVNLRQLKETDTIEFRHFPGTLNSVEFESCLRWCRDWLLQALTDQDDPVEMFETADPPYRIPKFKKYIHWMEVGYRMTVHDGTVKPEKIVSNIKSILKEPDILTKEFDLKFPRSKVPAKVPKAFNIRGTSGSGKSTLVFNLLSNFEFEPVTDPARPLHPYGYIIPDLNIFVVGSYASAAGGVDTLKDMTSQALFRVQAGLARGYHVLFEGLMVSGIKSLPIAVSSQAPLIAFTLTTPLETCLENVKRRRLARGETSELNPENTKQKFLAAQSSHRALEKTPNVKTFVFSNEEAFYTIVKGLRPDLLKSVTWSNEPTKTKRFKSLGLFLKP